MINPDRKRILQEVLRNEDYLAFRNDLYQSTLLAFQRQRWVRRRQQFLALAACLPALLCLYLLLLGPAPQPSNAVEIVRSVPLNLNQRITTTVLSGSLVSTQPARLAIISTVPSIQIVRTNPKEHPAEMISDDQLLKLFEGHALALTSAPSGNKRLVFLNAVDQAEFFPQ